VAHNYVANFHDAIDNATFGSQHKPGNGASVDFYGNDMFNITDNCIELDGGVHNMRAFESLRQQRSRLTAPSPSSAARPTSIAMFLQQCCIRGTETSEQSIGHLIYNNTFVGSAGALGPASNVHFRNNLIVGDGWKRPIFQVKPSRLPSSVTMALGQTLCQGISRGTRRPSTAPTAAECIRPMTRWPTIKRAGSGCP
jgi:hypothetical protein